MEKRPLILVTNDDGITAGGIQALVEVAQEFGEVVVVAPDSPQSGQGHAITIAKPIRLKESPMFGAIPSYECSGTPVDCVKLAKHVVLQDRKIDLCVSGINHGSNASINIIYSGTMSAAMEASLGGIDSIGFSLLNFAPDADFEAAKTIARKVIAQVLENSLQDSKLLNVNIPNLPLEQIKGIKVCRQADAQWVERFQEVIDPFEQKFYWLTGDFHNGDEGKDTDIWALEQGYASVVPSMHDLTAYSAIKKMTHLNIDL